MVNVLFPVQEFNFFSVPIRRKNNIAIFQRTNSAHGFGFLRDTRNSQPRHTIDATALKQQSAIAQKVYPQGKFYVSSLPRNQGSSNSDIS